MKLMIDTSGYVFDTTSKPLAAKEDENGIQRRERGTDRLLWVVQLNADHPDGAEAINVTVAGERPKLTARQSVVVTGLEAVPWKDRRTGEIRMSWRAASIVAASAVKAA